MTLKIKRHPGYGRKLTVITLLLTGLATLVGAPLSYAFTATSPSQDTIAVVSSAAKKDLEANSVVKKQTKTPKVAAATPSASRSADCTSAVKTHSGLTAATSPQLKKLVQYERVCVSGIVSQVSFFVPTPTSEQEARDYARDTTAQLREFSTYGISPLVFFEPTTPTGLVSLANYRAGAYDTALDTYFAAIKAAGITDTQMGTWVPLPEGNIPVWTSVHPDDFAACVTKAVTYQKKHFPGSKASVMLDTLSYPGANSWSGGRAVSFLPYVRPIPAGLIDSVGLQGFPWSPAANESGPTNGGPREYLRIDLAAEAARVLHVKDVWLNTGTFGTRYANQSGRQITASTDQRLAQLTGVVAQA
ncbi:MAG TPA: hypothetical protein VK502_03345, partial [Candidatus Saccharimonadales bacterium]|nr:hypothetical protein [Candidatus Saccharimonadales bacterium]